MVSIAVQLDVRNEPERLQSFQAVGGSWTDRSLLYH